MLKLNRNAVIEALKFAPKDSLYIYIWTTPNNQARIRLHDGYTQVILTIPAVDAPPNTHVAFGKFSKFKKLLKAEVSDIIELETTDPIDGYRYEDHLPSIVSPELVNVKEFQATLKSVSYAMGAVKNHRQDLNSIRFDGEKVIATNGQRLAIARSCLPAEDFVLDAAAVEVFNRIPSSVKTIALQVSSKSKWAAEFTVGQVSVKISTERVTDNYPDYTRVIPESEPATFTLPRKFETKSERIFLTPDGTLSETCPPRNTKPVQFNAKFFAEALKHLKGTDVQVELRGNLDPVILTAGDRKAVIMPMRL